MELKVIGAYGGESPNHRMTCFLLNNNCALDAGSLTRGLSLEEQYKIQSIVISHSHMDHITSLPFLVENVFGKQEKVLTLYCSKESMSNIKKNMFNNDTWPDFTKIPEKNLPTITFKEIVPEVSFEVGDLIFLPIKVNHIVPTLGFLITNEKTSILYSSDTAPTKRIWEIANATFDLKAVFLEISFHNNMEKVAQVSKHLIPKTVAEEIKKLKKDVPIYLYHMKPPCIKKIKEEVKELKISNLDFLIQDKNYIF